MAEKSKILIIGGTGYIGKYIVEASAKFGHPTFALVRESTLSAKSTIINNFKSLGVNILVVCFFNNPPPSSFSSFNCHKIKDMRDLSREIYTIMRAW